MSISYAGRFGLRAGGDVNGPELPKSVEGGTLLGGKKEARRAGRGRGGAELEFQAEAGRGGCVRPRMVAS